MHLMFYRKVLHKVCKDKDLKRVDVELLLFGSGLDYFSQNNLFNHFPASRTTIIHSLQRLTEEGYLKIVKQRSKHKSRLYRISGKSRRITNEIYNQLSN